MKAAIAIALTRVASIAAAELNLGTRILQTLGGADSCFHAYPHEVTRDQ